MTDRRQQTLDCFLYLARMMPRLAEQTQAAIMKAPCRNINSLDLEATVPGWPSPLGLPDTT